MRKIFILLFILFIASAKVTAQNIETSILWQKIYGGNYGANGYHIELTSDGGYVVAGETLSTDVLGNHGEQIVGL